MKNSLFFLVILLIIILSSCNTKNKYSISEFLEISGRTQFPTQSEYPDDGAVYLYENKITKMFFDDNWTPSIEESYESAIIYFNDKAEHYLTPVIYLDKKDILTFFEAKTIKQNGEVLELSKDDLYNANLNIADFTDNKSVKFTFPGVESGCIIEYKYKTKITRSSIHSQVWRIQRDIPKILSKYSIEFPQNFISAGYGWNFLPVNIELAPPEIKNHMRKTGILDYGTSSYTWELKNISALIYEPKMPPYDDIAQYLKVEVQYKDWNELSSKYWEKIKNKFHSDDLGEINKLVNNIVGSESSETAKIDSIYQYLQKDYRYISTDINESGIIPHHVDETIKNKYGDCKDLTVLAVVLLNNLGIEAHPALVKTSTKGQLRNSIINFDFNHMICYIKTNSNKEYWLDATGNSCNLGDIYPSIEGTTPLIIYKDGNCEFKKIPITPSLQNLVFRNIKIQIDTSGAFSGNVNMIFTGNQNLNIRLSLNSYSNSDLKKAVQRYAATNLAGIEIDSMHFDNPQKIDKSFKIYFTFNYKNSSAKNENLLIVNPSFFKMNSELNSLLDKDRRYPIQFLSTFKLNDLIEIYYNPKYFEMESLPAEILERFKLGSFIFKGNNIANGKIVFNRACTINKVNIIPENYQAVRKLQTALAQSENQNLVLKKHEI